MKNSDEPKPPDQVSPAEWDKAESIAKSRIKAAWDEWENRLRDCVRGTYTDEEWDEGLVSMVEAKLIEDGVWGTDARLQPTNKTRGHGFVLTLDWLSPREVLERWPKFNPRKLEELVRDMRLRVYSLDQSGEFQLVSEDALSRKSGGFFGGGALLDDCLFKLSDVQEFEEKNKGELKLRESRLCELRCRDLAFQWAREDPNLRPIDVVSELQKTQWGAPYTEKVLRRWLNEKPRVPLERGSGRPKGKD
ncbi:MAG: hypothetical protein ACLP5H_19465 [Desulfomonilaceae bacterium]